MELDEFTYEIFMEHRVGICGEAVRFGGSFMEHLAKALYRADLSNCRKLYSNWTKEWFQYYEFYLRSLSKEI